MKREAHPLVPHTHTPSVALPAQQTTGVSQHTDPQSMGQKQNAALAFYFGERAKINLVPASPGGPQDLTDAGGVWGVSQRS